MAYTLKKDNVYKTVATDHQKEGLERLGYAVVDGSADSSPNTSLHQNPYFQESMTESIHPAYRGIGQEGYNTNTMQHLVSKKSTGLTTPEQLAKLNTFPKENTEYKDIVFGDNVPEFANATADVVYLKTDGTALKKGTSAMEEI